MRPPPPRAYPPESRLRAELPHHRQCSSWPPRGRPHALPPDGRGDVPLDSFTFPSAPRASAQPAAFGLAMHRDAVRAGFASGDSTAGADCGSGCVQQREAAHSRVHSELRVRVCLAPAAARGSQLAHGTHSTLRPDEIAASVQQRSICFCLVACCFVMSTI
jgi:hypothetical protein